jgi:hypothetical protein
MPPPIEPRLPRALFYALALFIFLAAFRLYTQDLNAYPPGASFDEAVDMVDAGLVLQTKQIDFLVYSDGRPEILYRLLSAFLALGFGQSVFAFRLMTVFTGLLTLAVAGAAGRALFLRYPRPLGRLAALVGMSSLAVNLGFMTLTRSLYRGTPAVLFALLALVLTWQAFHALWKGRCAWGWFVGAAVCLGLTPHTYTAAGAATGLIAPLWVYVLLRQPRRYREWLGGVLLISVGLALGLAPIAYLQITNPERVFARSDVVADPYNRQDLLELLQLQDGTYLETHREVTYIRFLKYGDFNPQYNTQGAPLMPPWTGALFYLGLAFFLLTLGRLEALQTLALLVLAIIPITLSNEMLHGLRIILGYPVVPLLCAMGMGGVLWALYRLSGFFRPLAYAPSLLALALPLYFAEHLPAMHEAYRRFVDDYDAGINSLETGEMTAGEWFFRPQNGESAAYLRDLRQPIYMALTEMGDPPLRAFFQADYPTAKTWQDVPLPRDAEGNIPWPDGLLYSVAGNDQTQITQDFHLLVLLLPDEKSLYLLPPLTSETAEGLGRAVTDGTQIFSSRYPAKIIGRQTPLRAENLTFSPLLPANGLRFNKKLEVAYYTAPPRLQAGQAQTFCWVWRALGDVGRNKLATLQIWDADSRGLAGAEHDLWRWVYPSSVWRRGELIPVCQSLPLPSDLPAGLYWLGAGLFERHMDYWPVTDPNGVPVLGENVPVAALKVPQASLPRPLESPLKASLLVGGNEALRLLEYSLNQGANQLDLRLNWQALQPLRESYTVFVHIEDASGTLIAQHDSLPWDGRYPTFIWEAGEIVQTAHLLKWPGNALFPLRVYVGMYRLVDFSRLPVIQNEQADPSARILVEVIAAPAR